MTEFFLKVRVKNDLYIFIYRYLKEEKENIDIYRKSKMGVAFIKEEITKKS